MPTQIMGFQMEPDQLTGFFDNNPGGGIGYWKNLVIGSDPVVADIFLEPNRDLMWQEGNLRLFSAFWIPNDSLPVFDILRSEFQDLADSHAAAGHEFK
jgi:hypothetical protein